MFALYQRNCGFEMAVLSRNSSILNAFQKPARRLAPMRPSSTSLPPRDRIGRGHSSGFISYYLSIYKRFKPLIVVYGNRKFRRKRGVANHNTPARLLLLFQYTRCVHCSLQCRFVAGSIKYLINYCNLQAMDAEIPLVVCITEGIPPGELVFRLLSFIRPRSFVSDPVLVSSHKNAKISKHLNLDS